jgi:hypothetical protein
MRPRHRLPNRMSVIDRAHTHNSYQDGRIGDTPVSGPLVLGREFSAGRGSRHEALDGNFEPLQPGMRVAVDPAQPWNGNFFTC